MHRNKLVKPIISGAIATVILVLGCPSAHSSDAKGPSLSTVTFALSVVDEKPVEPDFRFPEDTTELFAVFDYSGMTPETTWRWRLSREGTLIRQSAAMPWKDKEAGRYVLLLKFPGEAGIYDFDLFLNGQRNHIPNVVLGSPTPSKDRLLQGGSIGGKEDGWVLSGKAKTSYMGDQYAIALDDGNDRAWATSGRAFGDAILEVDAGPLSGTDRVAYGLVVRYQNDQNFYGFVVDTAGKYAVFYLMNGALNWVREWESEEPDIIHQGHSPNHLRVLANGPTLRFYVNDRVLGAVSAALWPSGRAGILVVGRGEQGGQAGFENWRISALPPRTSPLAEKLRAAREWLVPAAVLGILLLAGGLWYFQRVREVEKIQPGMIQTTKSFAFRPRWLNFLDRFATAFVICGLLIFVFGGISGLPSMLAEGLGAFLVILGLLRFPADLLSWLTQTWDTRALRRGHVLVRGEDATTLGRVIAWHVSDAGKEIVRYGYHDHRGLTHEGTFEAEEEASLWDVGDRGLVIFKTNNPEQSVWDNDNQWNRLDEEDLLRGKVLVQGDEVMSLAIVTSARPRKVGEKTEWVVQYRYPDHLGQTRKGEMTGEFSDVGDTGKVLFQRQSPEASTWLSGIEYATDELDEMKNRLLRGEVIEQGDEMISAGTVTALREIASGRQTRWVIHYNYRDHLGHPHEGEIESAELPECKVSDKGRVFFQRQRPEESAWVGDLESAPEESEDPIEDEPEFPWSEARAAVLNALSGTLFSVATVILCVVLIHISGFIPTEMVKSLSVQPRESFLMLGLFTLTLWFSFAGMYLCGSRKIPKEVLQNARLSIRLTRLADFFRGFFVFYQEYKKLFGADLFVWMFRVSVPLILLGALVMVTSVRNVGTGVEAIFKNGAVKATSGDYTGALEEIATVITMFPDYAKGYVDRGVKKKDLGDLDGALADYTQAIAIDPNDARAYLNRGAIRAMLQDQESAMGDFTRAITIRPQYTLAYTNRGALKASIGDQQGALADYTQATTLNPNNAEAFFGRGYAKSELGDHQAAISDFTKAITINPRHNGAYVNRGLSKADLGDHQGALLDFAQALKLDPNDAYAYHGRGQSKAKLGDPKGAIADYTQAIKVSPQFASAYCDRGSAKERAGDHQGAQDDLARARGIDPHSC